MNQARLEHLITVLEGVENDRRPFNLGEWAFSRRDLESDFRAKATTNLEACGSACCALGYAALDPQLQAEGLFLSACGYTDFSERIGPDGNKIHGYVRIASVEAFNRLASNPKVAQVAAVPEFEGHMGFNAGAEFFGISRAAASYLFSPSHYKSGNDRPIPPSEVIARVREMIANNGLSPVDAVR